MRWLSDFDMQAFRAIHVDLHRSWLDPIFWIITGTGLGWVQAALVLPLVKWRSTRAYVFPLLLTLIVSGVLVANVLKALVPRDRPSNLAVAVLQDEQAFARSFPSGHTTTSFGLAFMLLLLLRKTDRLWIAQLALVWAGLVGLSRVYRGLHWPTDVIGGAFAGMFAAALVYLLLDRLGKLSDLDVPETSHSGQEVGP